MDENDQKAISEIIKLLDAGETDEARAALVDLSPLEYKPAEYPKWVEHPKGKYRSAVAQDEKHEEQIKKHWAELDKQPERKADSAGPLPAPGTSIPPLPGDHHRVQEPQFPQKDDLRLGQSPEQQEREESEKKPDEEDEKADDKGSGSDKSDKSPEKKDDKAGEMEVRSQSDKPDVPGKTDKSPRFEATPEKPSEKSQKSDMGLGINKAGDKKPDEAAAKSEPTKSMDPKPTENKPVEGKPSVPKTTEAIPTIDNKGTETTATQPKADEPHTSEQKRTESKQPEKPAGSL